MGLKSERWYCLGGIPGSTIFFVSKVKKLDTVGVSVLAPTNRLCKKREVDLNLRFLLKFGS